MNPISEKIEKYLNESAIDDEFIAHAKKNGLDAKRAGRYVNIEHNGKSHSILLHGRGPKSIRHYLNGEGEVSHSHPSFDSVISNIKSYN